MTAKTTGRFRRGGSYYVRVVLPEGHPLRELYRSGRVVQAIGACIFREASRRALDRRLQLLGAPIQTLASSSAVPQQPIKQVLPAPQDLALVQVYDRWAEGARRHGRASAVAIDQVLIGESGLLRGQGEAFHDVESSSMPRSRASAPATATLGSRRPVVRS